MNWIEIIGWLGALFTASAYSMRDMKLLRTVAIAANLSFVTYGFVASVWPMFALHIFLLPLNTYRLYEIIAATNRLRRSEGGGLPTDVLKPFLMATEFPAGAVLFQRGDKADRIYFLEDGEVTLSQLEKTLKPGTLFGEMAYFSADKTRTMSAVCQTSCRISSIDETDFMRLFNQNPEFGFYVIRLIAQRLLDGSSQRPELYENFARGGA